MGEKRSNPRPRHRSMEKWGQVVGTFSLSLLPMLIKEAHGVDHCNRREVITTIRKNWWSSYLASMVNKGLRECDLCAKWNMHKHFTAPIRHIPEPRGPFRHLVMDFVDTAKRRGGKR